ncbi:MAG: PAS domain S-box protein [PVC group bacterium]|nr:PAS domain S-box protein [PVC group bacterium]
MSAENQNNQEPNLFKEALQQNPRQQKKAVLDMFKAFSSALRMIPLYPATHPMVKGAIEKATTEITLFVSKFGDMSIDMMDNNVMLYEEVLEEAADASKNLIVNLKKFSIQGLLFKQDFGAEELEKFLRLLVQKPEELEKRGGLKQAIIDDQITNIQIIEVRYARITEDEEVKQKGDGGGGGGGDVPGGVVPAVEGEGAPEGKKGKDIVGMVSDFLGGKSDVVPEKELISLEFKKHTKRLVKQLLKLVGPQKAVEEVIKIIKERFDKAGLSEDEQAPYLDKVKTETIKLKQPKVTKQQMVSQLKKLQEENVALKSKLKNVDGMVDEKVGEVTQELIHENRKIKKEKDRINSVLKHVAEGLVIVDNDGKVMLLNQAAEDLLGVDKESKIGQNILEGLHDEHVVSLSKDKQHNVEIELAGSSEDTKKTLRASSAVIENEEGETVGMVSVLSDITKQKEVNKMKDAFVSNVSHELRAPLISIQKSLSLILDTADKEKLDPQQKQFLEIASNNATRLTELVNDLLDVAKLEAGRMKAEFASTSLVTVVDSVVDMLGVWANSRGISLEKQIPDTLNMDIDAKMLNQVFTNLIGNAVKFTPEGGKVILSAEDMGKEVKICVSDTGCGIPKESLDCIFEKFEQSKTVPVAGSPKGTGLGLSIVKEIVGLHGGKIWAESEDGNGTQFYFVLPKEREVLDIRD